MKYVYTICLLLLLAVFSCKTRKAGIQTSTKNNFRVVGYMLSGTIAKGQASKFDLSQLTHLDIFFNGTGANGKFKHVDHLDGVIDAAHKNNVKVIATIGNGVGLSLLTKANRAAFIDSLVKSAVELQIDGIDVDLEGDHIDSNYESFVGDLSAALRSKGKLTTAAIATWESVQLTDKALSCFDFLSVMTYDATGPWNLKEPGPHSPFSMAVADLDFWTNKRHIVKDKLNLGLPFYGYSFGPDTPREFHYRQIVDKYPGAELTDQVNGTPGNIVYYNGIATIKKKTEFAMQNAGGVMIWELSEDAADDRSLLKAVNSVVKAAK